MLSPKDKRELRTECTLKLATSDTNWNQTPKEIESCIQVTIREKVRVTLRAWLQMQFGLGEVGVGGGVSAEDDNGHTKLLVFPTQLKCKTFWRTCIPELGMWKDTHSYKLRAGQRWKWGWKAFWVQTGFRSNFSHLVTTEQQPHPEVCILTHHRTSIQSLSEIITIPPWFRLKILRKHIFQGN